MSPAHPGGDQQRDAVAESTFRAVDQAGEPGVPPVPIGFGVVLDPAAKELEPGLWFGGQPARVLRLTAPGWLAWERLRSGGVTDRQTGLLARRLTDAGLAHPVPPPADADGQITVVIPVYDRPTALDRCLAGLGTDYPVVVVDDGSADELSTRAVAHRHGVRLVRLGHNVGPAAARNAGLAEVQTPLVAFLDSDTRADAGWISALAPHLDDPAVAAVAPRVTPAAGAAYGRLASSLDLGDRQANVVPYGTVSYVPSAALLARRAALVDVARGGHVFDPALRTGEDVDLVWRLLAGRWRVRYEPAATVPHEEPATARERWSRRRGYGRAAAPLSRKHPGSIAPMVVHPWYAATVAALLARRPALAAVAYGGAVIVTRRSLRRLRVPTDHLLPAVLNGVRQTGLGAGRYGVQFAAPALLVAAAHPPARASLAVLALAPSVCAWWAHRRDIDPLRFTAAHLADQVAYGEGVLAGCVRHRTARPLRPKIIRRLV